MFFFFSRRQLSSTFCFHFVVSILLFVKPKCDNQKAFTIKQSKFRSRSFVYCYNPVELPPHPAEHHTEKLRNTANTIIAIGSRSYRLHTYTFPHTQQRAQEQRFIRVSVAIVIVVDRACLSIIIDTFHLQFTCALWLCRCFFCPRCVVVQLKKVTLNNANAAATPTCRTHTHTHACVGVHHANICTEHGFIEIL